MVIGGEDMGPQQLVFFLREKNSKEQTVLAQVLAKNRTDDLNKILKVATKDPITLKILTIADKELLLAYPGVQLSTTEKETLTKAIADENAAQPVKKKKKKRKKKKKKKKKVESDIGGNAGVSGASTSVQSNVSNSEDGDNPYADALEMIEYAKTK